MKIACIQITSGADIAANIARVETLVADAASQGAVFVALPENVFLMEAPGEKRERYTQDQHPGVLAASAMAKKHGIWLLVGSVAVRDEGTEKPHNRSLLFDPSGAAVAQYDKIHLFDVTLAGGETYAESTKMLAGDKLVIAALDDGSRMTDNEKSSFPSSAIRPPPSHLGLTICYDVRFPHLYRALAKAGADILAVPSAFTQTTGEAHWHVLLRARAIENGCYVIAPAQTGTHPGGRKTYGHALIVDPWGKVLADAGTEEGVIVADLDMGLVQQIHERLPSLQHDREFT